MKINENNIRVDWYERPEIREVILGKPTEIDDQLEFLKLIHERCDELKSYWTLIREDQPDLEIVKSYLDEMEWYIDEHEGLIEWLFPVVSNEQDKIFALYRFYLWMRDFDNNQMLTYLTMLSDRSGLTGIGERMADRPQILTDQQAIVAQYTLLGYKQNEISEILDITPQAVNDHLKRVSPKANKV